MTHPSDNIQPADYCMICGASINAGNYHTCGGTPTYCYRCGKITHAGLCVSAPSAGTAITSSGNPMTVGGPVPAFSSAPPKDDREFIARFANCRGFRSAADWERMRNLAGPNGLVGIATLRLDLAESRAQVAERDLAIKKWASDFSDIGAAFNATIDDLHGLCVAVIGFDPDTSEELEIATEKAISMRRTASFPGHYISTACQRDKHEHCRRADKWAGEPCQCDCGHAGAAKNIGLRKATTEDLIERVLEGAWEDADSDDLNGLDELQTAVNAFNEANSGIDVYMVDYSEAIVLDASILEEWRREQGALASATPPAETQARISRGGTDPEGTPSTQIL